MTEDEILSEFRSVDALLEGHFLLSSGLHSAYYLQCARLLMNPERAGRIALAISQKMPRELRTEIQAVISPAMGGIVIGHEMGRALGVDAMFVERPEGVFALRRGFTLTPGA
jgi:orotate phosphoribosyltransferase